MRKNGTEEERNENEQNLSQTNRITHGQLTVTLSYVRLVEWLHKGNIASLAIVSGDLGIGKIERMYEWVGNDS